MIGASDVNVFVFQQHSANKPYNQIWLKIKDNHTKEMCRLCREAYINKTKCFCQLKQ